MRYLFAEVTRGYLLEENEQLYTEKQRRFHTFMKTPRELEKVSHVHAIGLCPKCSSVIERSAHVHLPAVDGLWSLHMPGYVSIRIYSAPGESVLSGAHVHL